LTADTCSKVADMRVQIEILMRGLKDVEKAVIVGLFALNGVEETENTLAAKYGLTRERIRQIKWEALEKMAALTK
jgi:DNA-directed RNA polymerase sigma subunit (sigma70/sigma32)